VPTYLEFFAGGGMARAGLGPAWKCLLANDFDPKKAHSYSRNWGSENLVVCDIRDLLISHLTEKADLAWASFPCQDLSLAGAGAGLRGERSGTFWPFIKKIEELSALDRQPKIVALENVSGTLTSHAGRDFGAIIEALQDLNYDVGAFIADAALFVPQSRPRLFVIGVTSPYGSLLSAEGPSAPWHNQALRRAYCRLPKSACQKWIWWRLPTPQPRDVELCDLLECEPSSVKWHSTEETKSIIDMMSETNKFKLKAAQSSGMKTVGALYRRTRWQNGQKVQRAEIRFDIAGCLRTPAGGSSRQSIIIVEGQSVRSRLMSSRETARLMGLPDSYKLPDGYNDAYHLTGDGVVVPVVSHLAKYIFEPALSAMLTMVPDDVSDPLQCKPGASASDRSLRRNPEAASAYAWQSWPD